MHALRLPVAAPLVDVESDGWSVAVLELGFEQPATSRLAAPMAATILSGWRKWVSSFVPPPAERGKCRAHPNARRRLRRHHPSGFSDVLHNSDPEGPGDVAGPFQRPGSKDPRCTWSEGQEGGGGEHLGADHRGPLVDAEVALVDVVRRAARCAGAETSHGAGHPGEVPGEVLATQALGGGCPAGGAEDVVHGTAEQCRRGGVVHDRWDTAPVVH